MINVSRAEIEAEQAKRDFALFVKLAWPSIEPGTFYVPGWHIDAIATHLTALARGDIKRLLVNMPPRHAKSSLISVLWPVWMWLQDPSLRFLCASYDMPLAVRDNRKCRLLIRSDWFQERYGGLFQLRRDQNEKSNFENSKGGYRIATSVGGGTGKGGDILIIDDPHPIEQKKGAIRREAVLDWFKDTWSTRLNSQIDGKMIVVGQRVHDEDLSGYILNGNAGEAWVHLNLPAEYEEGSPCRTYIGSGDTLIMSGPVCIQSFTDPSKNYDVTFEEGKAVSCTCEAFTYHPEKPCKHMRTAKAPVVAIPTGQELWHDPRTQEGELLWPARFPQDVIDKEKRVHGPQGYAALYQQRPVPASGNVLNVNHRRWFSVDETTGCYLLETPRGIKPVFKRDCWLFATVDLAISEKQSADFTVLQAWAVTPFKDLLLLDIVRDHFTHPEQQEQIVLFHQRFGFQFIAVESVAYQLALIQDLLPMGIPCKPYTPQADKVTRASTVAIWYANGKCYHLKDAPWLFVFEKEIFTFPKAAKKDQMDCTSLAGIVVCNAHTPGVWSPEDEKTVPDTTASIEEILDAEQIEEERRLIAEQERATTAIDPFAWAELHIGGGW